jgi:hypothetical protein
MSDRTSLTDDPGEDPHMDVVDHPDRQFGQFYPEEDVLAVIPDVESGEPVRDVLE